MKNAILIIMLSIICIFSNVYAFRIASIDSKVIQGAEIYDWQNCIDSMRNYCINTTCLTSEEIHCKDSCVETAKDKCLSEGVKAYDNNLYYNNDI